MRLRPSRDGHRRRFFRPLVERLEDRRLLSVFYDLGVATVSGQQTTDGDTIDSIDPFVSIDDNARTAYVANVSGPDGNGSALIVDDAISTPLKISFGNPTADRAFAFPQINNAGLVAVRDRFTGINPADSFIRTWDSSSPGTYNIVAGTNESQGDSFDIVTLPTINSSGAVGFLGFTNGSADAGVYSNPFATRGQDIFLTDVTGSGGLRPMMSDDEQIIVRRGTDLDAELLLLDAASGAAATIASTNSGHWATLGNSPGISDDGQVVVFYGELTPEGAATLNAGQRDAVPVPLTPGRGVFASVVIGGNRHIIRIAGEVGNGFVDPGEQAVGLLDFGPDFNFDGASDWDIVNLGGGGFSTSSRVGVTNMKPFADATKGSFVTVVYHANDFVGAFGGPAIYTSRLNLFKDASGNLMSMGVEAPIQVVKAGDDVPGLGVIEDVALYDPINSFGIIAFWASAAGGKQGVVAATRNSAVDHQVPGYTRPRFDPDSPLVEYVVADALGASPRKSITQIVMHATGGGETSTLKTFRGEKGIHYLINREGRVTQMTPEGSVANHAIPINRSSIGIELVDDFVGDGTGTGHIENEYWLTDIQRKKAALLVRDIALRNNIRDFGGVVQHLVAPDDPGYVPFAFEVVVPLVTGTTAQGDGIDTTHQGVLGHGQIFNRSKDRTDPQNFPDAVTSPGTTYNWSAFMTEVNQGIGLTLNSPANLLVTDPMGRRVGVDPATGQTLLEIPGATFTGASTEPQSIAVPGGIDGQYQVRVVGTGSGMFHLDLYAASRGAELMRTQVADQISAGASFAYSLNYTTQVGGHATVTGAANLPPVAFDDEFFSRGDDPVPIPVLGNDTDPEGLLDPASIAILLAPNNGTTMIDVVAGIISYAPNPGFVGEDSFSYRVADNQALPSGSATIRIHVARQTQSPLAADDNGILTPFETPVVIDVLSNDSDPDGTLDLTSVRIDHDGDPENGSVTIDPVTGRITYTPDPDFFGTDTVGYEVLDNDGANSNIATVTITISAPDSAEVALTGDGQVIVAGDTQPDIGDGTDFGLIPQNQPGPTRVFTVRNIGVEGLTPGPVSLPIGFTLVEPLASNIAPGASDTFSVQVTTATLGVFGGLVSFFTNDPDENPFQFSIQASVAIPPGSLDLTFGGGDGKVAGNSGTARSVVLQPDGKILVGGGNGGVTGFMLARYNPDGSPDANFGGGDGQVVEGFPLNASEDGEHILLLADGKIMLVGYGATVAGAGVGFMRFNSDGSLDATFDGDGKVIRLVSISFLEDAALQADGKIVVVGTNSSSGSNDFAVARFNSDGSIDTSFAGGDGLAITDFGSNGNDPARALAIAADGKIVVAGVANGSDFGLARYNADGTLDAAFGGGDGLVATTLGHAANDLVLQPDGRIVLVGEGVLLARYNSDGTLDTTFGDDGLALANLGQGERGRSVALQPDGKIVVAGEAVPGNGDYEFFVARYHPDGSLDLGFDGDGYALTDFVGFNDFGNAVALQPDGKIVVAGAIFPSSSGLVFALARYYGDATVLPSVTLVATDAEGAEIGPDGIRFAVTRTGDTDRPLTVLFEVQNDGVAGQATRGADFQFVSDQTQVTIPAGASSAEININVLTDSLDEEDELVTLAILSNPEYFIGLPFIADAVIQGECEQVALDGTLDPTFGGGDGFVATDFGVGFTFSSSLAIQSDGKVLVAARVGGQETVGIARYRMNGIPDPSFDNDGLVIVSSLGIFANMRPLVGVQSDGRILAAGESADSGFGLVRLEANGSVDVTFGGGDGLATAKISPFVDLVNAMLVQPDGKILLAGQSSNFDTGGDFSLARFHPDGTLDATFGGGDGLVTTHIGPGDMILDLAMQSDGKIVAVGSTSYNGQFFTGADWGLARYNPDGTLDTTFGGAGTVTTSIHDSDTALSVALRTDGKIVVSGSAIIDHPIGSNEAEAVLALFNPDGTLETAFGDGGLVLERFVNPSPGNDAASSVVIQPDGKIVVIGADNGNLAVARYSPDGTRDTGFGGGDGVVTAGNVATGAHIDAARQPDGKLVATVQGGGINLRRFTGPCTGDVVERCNLEVTVTSDVADSVVAGGNVSYTITVTNTGSGASNVVLTDVLPASTTFVSFAAPPGWTATTPAVGSTGTATASISSLASSETASFTLIVHVHANTPNGTTLTNTASAATTTPDANPDNNSDSTTATVTDINTVIWGYVYVDVNNDGLKGTSELALPNVPVTLSGPVTMSVLTDANGRYEFKDLLPGTYSIEARQPSAFVDGRETSGTSGVGDVANDRFDAVQLQSGQQLGNYNFGERGLRAELITKRLYLASTPSPTVLVEGLMNSGENWFFFRAARSAVLTASIADGEKPLEMYTESMMPVSLGMDSSPLATEVMAGAGYYVYAAGARGQELILELGPDLDARGPNPANPLDASDDGDVSPLDALLVINALNRRGAGESTHESRKYYLDTNGDGSLTPLDALLIINQLNRPGGPAEGESTSASEVFQEQVESSWRAVSDEDVKTFRDVQWIVNAYDDYLRNTRRHRHFPVYAS